MREIIVDRENGAKAFVLFELTKGNIAEIKDRYILEQLRSAIDSPWSTALPDGIRSALTRSVSEEMICKCLHHRLVLRIVHGIGIFEQELNTLGKLLITENIQVVGGIAHIVFRAILLLHLNLVVAVPVLTLRTAKEPNVIFKAVLVNITVCILLRDILECKIFKHAKLLPIHVMLGNLIVRKAFARCIRKHSLKLPGSV